MHEILEKILPLVSMHKSCEQIIPIEQYLNDMLTGFFKIACVDLVTRRNSFNSGFSIDFLMLLSRPFLSVPQTKFQV